VLTAGDVGTAALHVAVVPRSSLSVTTDTLKSLGELYDSVRDHGVYVHSHLKGNNRTSAIPVTPGWRRIQPRCCSPALTATLSYGVRSDDAELARDQTLFALLMGMRESSISGVYVQGRSVA
jgi:hypothetical protein